MARAAPVPLRVSRMRTGFIGTNAVPTVTGTLVSMLCPALLASSVMLYVPGVS